MTFSYTRADFTNKTEVRWCPGCGDYAILSALQKLLPELGLPPEQHVFISGIGCAGRLPYYMNTYGFHTIHGRAPAIATGLKAMREDLVVWVITGDGDALSIGGNHFLHCLRRNVNLNILLFNNQVYGLTKGQFSPTSQKGQVTKTSPEGVQAEPINPIRLALAAGASFVARSLDKDPAHLALILKEAYQHEGCSFVEIYQDCHIFNPGAFDGFSLKNNRLESTLLLKKGEPYLYGKNQERALHLDQNQWKCLLDQDMGNLLSADGQALACHQPEDRSRAFRLADLHFPDFPVPLGIFYQAQAAVFASKKKCEKTFSDLNALFRAKASWEH